MNDFYIGYLPKPPADLARFIGRVVVIILVLTVVVGCTLVLGQRHLAASFFEFDSVTSFEGVIEEKPYPTLLVRRPGSTSPEAQFSRYLLVGAGKHGLDPDVFQFDGQAVVLQGKLIFRAGQTMVELMPGSVRKAGTGGGGSLEPHFGPVVSIRGEIVDSKCHAGVMNPGEGKVHRDCAVRCLSGGVPPVLVEAAAPHRLILLAGANGRQLQPVTFLDRVAEPVVAVGKLVSRGDRLQLLVDHVDRADVSGPTAP